MIRIFSALSVLFLLLGCAGAALPVEQPARSSPIQFQDMKGRHYDVAAITGSNRRVAFVFWQTWCSSCIQEAPAFVEAARKWAGKIDFFGVVSGPDDVVDDQAVAAMARKLNLPYPQVRDRDLKLTNRFHVEGTPTIVVLSSPEKVLFNSHDIPDWDAFF